MKKSNKIMFRFIIIPIYVMFAASECIKEEQVCEIGSKSCEEKYIFYDINPPEGFNLRRDVYMRYAIMLAEAHKIGSMLNWTLVLPPWYRMYHWRKPISNVQPYHWSAFFDVDSLKKYAKVVELHEVFAKNSTEPLEIDILFVIRNFFEVFSEKNDFRDMWKVDGPCDYDGQFWGYNNVTAKETLCLKYQGRVRNLLDVIKFYPKATKIMFHHAEIPLFDRYGDKNFWDCRKSMKYNKNLIKTARIFTETNLNCSRHVSKCDTYISAHWRRQDFKHSYENRIPSINGAATQILKHIVQHYPDISNVFIATDADKSEKEELKKYLTNFGYTTHFYIPSDKILNKYGEGGVAIIEQIICSHAKLFIGTQESTFTHRIEQEREILGFDSDDTFNTFCPDLEPCKVKSKWKMTMDY